jgi:hypothetical protein
LTLFSCPLLPPGSRRGVRKDFGFILPVLVNESFSLEGEMIMTSARNISFTTLLFTLLIAVTGFATIAYRNSVPPPQLACHDSEARQNNSGCAEIAQQTNDRAGELGLRQLAPDL